MQTPDLVTSTKVFERRDHAVRVVIPEEPTISSVFRYRFWTFTFMIAPGAGTYARRTP
ncbi:hypothetical protein SynROS8604_01955 [Synechococcus sp. ROS8604]|nr:hypothetical protein SynROS8604_01955 [Synechococcus sp. ROS8604]